MSHDVYNFMCECGLSRIELCLRKATVAAVAKKVVGDVDMVDFDSLKIFMLGFFGRRRLHLSQSLEMFRLEVDFESFLALSSVLMAIISHNGPQCQMLCLCNPLQVTTAALRGTEKCQSVSSSVPRLQIRIFFLIA